MRMVLNATKRNHDNTITKESKKQEARSKSGTGIIVEHSWNVLSRERIGGVGDQQTGFTDGAITDNDTLDVLHDD